MDLLIILIPPLHPFMLRIPIPLHLNDTSRPLYMGLLQVIILILIPPPPAYAPYPNPGYALVAPQPYRPPTIYGSMATHFLGGVFGQLVSQVANQDMFGDGFNFADLIAGFFT